MHKTGYIPGLALALVAVLAAPGTAFADDDRQRTITVSGSGIAAGTPDQANISAGVQSVAPTVAEATADNQAAVANVMKALRAQGVAAKDIQTSNYSIWPVQQYDRNGSGEATITGYRVNNTVNVLVRDIGKLSGTLGAVTEAGANTIDGISFSVENDAELEQQARAAAMADARATAESLAKLAGVRLGDVVTISLSSSSGRPMPLSQMRNMAMAEAAPPPDISTGQLNVSVNVQVVYAIQ